MSLTVTYINKVMSEFSSNIIFVVQGATLLDVVFTKLQALEISSRGISPDMTASMLSSRRHLHLIRFSTITAQPN